MSQSTSLLEKHIQAGARMMDFAGWNMPVQYGGILEEYHAVRGACGVFDISHMGEFFVKGPGAADWLESLLTNRIANLEINHAQYSLLLNDSGGVIDDLYVYRVRDMEFLLIVNASKIPEDEKWMRDHIADEVTFENLSGLYSALAVQGPQAPAIFHKCFGRDLPPSRNRVVELERGGEALWVATTGYTGEVGFEIVFRNKDAAGLWDALLLAGAVPCGLGARDLLRLEMAYPLNGSDLSPDHTPLEAGLGFFVDLEKGPFPGRDVLLQQKQSDIPTKLSALVVDGKSPPIRSHYPVMIGGEILAETTSGGLSPALGTSIAMAYLPTKHAIPNASLDIEVRGQKYPAHVIKKPFFKKTK
ncbi:MAG: glycine cleavage system aminomethyltransferase GcvT [Terrimicrobiaceae bacterium]